MSITTYPNGIRFIKSKYDKIYYHGSHYPHRFDTNQLFEMLLNYTNYEEDDNIFSIYTKINNDRFVLTLNFQKNKPTITISIRDNLNGVTSNNMHEVDSSNFPNETSIFQFTENPVIILMTCYFFRDTFYSIYQLYGSFCKFIDTMYDKLENHKNYELDITTIIVLSIFTESTWYDIKDVVTKYKTTFFEKLNNINNNMSIMEITLKNNNISYFIARSNTHIYRIPESFEFKKIKGNPLKIYKAIQQQTKLDL